METAAEIVASGYDRMEEVKQFDESKMGVKGLTDSGITSIPKFFIHSSEVLSGIKAKPSQTSINIPVIDLSYMYSASQRPQVIKQVKEAAATWGFFQVTNHGVSQSTADSIINAVKSFHDQPHDIKSRYYKRDDKRGNNVTYSCNEDLYRAKAATWRDSLRVSMGSVAADPKDIPEVCKKEVIEWDTRAKKVADAVLELLSEGLGLGAGKFKELTFTESRYFLGHCYPCCPQPDLTLGITSHTDPSIITVLLQNEIQGLQVKHEDEWVNVKPVPGGLIINVGDLLEIASNGEYKSVEHRVLANSSKESRISVVEFCSLRKWRGSGYYGPLPELLSTEKPAVYRNFTMQEFYENFYSTGFDSKSLIEKIKISDNEK